MLSEYGVDLAAWWRARRWRALLELIEQLPASSRLNEAIHNDPDQARLIAMAREYRAPDDDGDDEGWTPRLSEFDLHAYLLVQVANAVAAVHGALTQQTHPPLPMPRTEVERQQEALAYAAAVRTGTRFGFSPDDF